MEVNVSAPPRLLWISGEERRHIVLWRTPFTIGRRPDQDLVLNDPRASRQHAEIVQQGGAEAPEYWLRDLASRHGTCVNGERIERCPLRPGDRMEFGTRHGDVLVFEPVTGTAHEFLRQMQELERHGPESELEKLSVFLDLARQLHRGNVLEDVLATLLEATLRVTGAERGLVFLWRADGELAPVAGRTAAGEPLTASASISHSVVAEAAASSTEFLLTDTLSASMVRGRESILAHELRMILCLPLRPASGETRAMGVLYLDSRVAGARLTSLSRDILRTIATEAAAVIENARLMEAEARAQRVRQELEIAAAIQQGLMPAPLAGAGPARLRYHCLPCHEVGGDFIVAMEQEGRFSLAVADVSGKGISAALLASTLQGMLHAQLRAGLPLDEVAGALHAFLRERRIEDRYVTLVLARLDAAGRMEWLNCGHIPPLLVRPRETTMLSEGSLPLGLPLELRGLKVQQLELAPGDRLLLATDGVTESERDGECFGMERLVAATRGADPFANVLAALHEFRQDAPLEDDCTLVEALYRGPVK